MKFRGPSLPFIQSALNPVQPRAQHSTKAASRDIPALPASLSILLIAELVNGAFLARRRVWKSLQTCSDTVSGRLQSLLATIVFEVPVVIGSRLVFSGSRLVVRVILGLAWDSNGLSVGLFFGLPPLIPLAFCLSRNATQ